jgi:hypothetical protein
MTPDTRHDPDEVCFALVERKPIGFTIRQTRPLLTIVHDVVSILDRYGKSIAPKG